MNRTECISIDQHESNLPSLEKASTTVGRSNNNTNCVFSDATSKLPTCGFRPNDSCASRGTTATSFKPEEQYDDGGSAASFVCTELFKTPHIVDCGAAAPHSGGHHCWLAPPRVGLDCPMCIYKTCTLSTPKQPLPLLPTLDDDEDDDECEEKEIRSRTHAISRLLPKKCQDYSSYFCGGNNMDRPHGTFVDDDDDDESLQTHLPEDLLSSFELLTQQHLLSPPCRDETSPLRCESCDRFCFENENRNLVPFAFHQRA